MVTIPSQLCELAGLKAGDSLEWDYLGRGVLRVEKVIDDLVSFAEENIHGLPVDFVPLSARTTAYATLEGFSNGSLSVSPTLNPNSYITCVRYPF